jgi:ABC-type multidrug transport system fused ATPase/permease subunit
MTDAMDRAAGDPPLEPAVPAASPTATSGELYRALWHYAEGKRASIFWGAALLVGAELLRLSVPFLAAQAINALQTGGFDAMGKAARWVGLIFLASVCAWALHGPGRVLERNVAIRVRENLADTLNARLLALPLAWHEQHHSGETIHRVNQSTGALYGFAQSQFIYLQNLVNVVGPIIALMLISLQVGIAALVFYGLIMWAIVNFDHAMMRLATLENAAERRLQAAQVDSVGNIVSILALRLQKATRELLRLRLSDLFGPLRRSIVLNEAKWCSVDLLSTATWCVLVGLYAWLAQRDAQASGAPLLLGGIFMVHQYTQQAGGVITAIASHYQSFSRTRADFASAAPLLQASAAGAGMASGAAAATEAPTATEAHTAARAGWRTLTLDGLVFTHPRQRGDRPTLDRLDLELRRGSRVALVGESGSGKSSLLRILAGLYAPQAGRVRLDGAEVPLAQVAPELATLIPQDAEVFEATLRENLAMSGEVDPSQLRTAIETACLDALVAEMPKGLDTAITERGGNLSGGQRQRIALARGLIAARDSSLLLLDEVTSSLDAGTEATVFERLFRMRADACIVTSVHRLHLLPRFDVVVYMSEGRVIDHGPADALAQRQPAFRALVEKSGAAQADEDAGATA